MSFIINLQGRFIELSDSKAKMVFNSDDSYFYLNVIALVAQKMIENKGLGHSCRFVSVADFEDEAWAYNEQKARKFGSKDKMLLNIYQKWRGNLNPGLTNTLSTSTLWNPDPSLENVRKSNYCVNGKFFDMQAGRSTDNAALTIRTPVEDIKIIPLSMSRAASGKTDQQAARNDTSLRSTGIFPDTRSAIQAIANEMPEVEEVVFVAYVGKLFDDGLKMPENNWKIKHLRFLLRDLDAISPNTSGEIPCDPKRILRRKNECGGVIDTINEQARHTYDYPPEIKFYRSQPCLRGMLVKKQDEEQYCAGFMSIYKQREPKVPIDYAARHSPVIRLSNDNIYEKALLESFSNWFRFVWDKGSYSK